MKNFRVTIYKTGPGAIVQSDFLTTGASVSAVRKVYTDRGHMAGNVYVAEV